jgi:hypothetical protein
MKTTKLLMSAAIATLGFLAACEKSKDVKTPLNAGSPVETTINARPPRTMGPCEPNAYMVTLINSNVIVETANGPLYEWTWSVQNPAPGNGTNGTTQDMSHWGFPINACVDLSTLASAAYSGNGVDWTTFTPNVTVDISQACMTSAVLKFNYGTYGGNPSYYRIYTTVPYEIDMEALAYYKSGSNTGCCVFAFDGMYCGGDDGEIR